MIQHSTSGAVKVKRDGPRGWHWIAAASFDPARHELVEHEAPAAALSTDTAPGPSVAQASAPATRKPRAAKTPHRKEAAHGDR